MTDKKKPTSALKNYLVFSGVALVIAVACIFIWKIYSQTTASDVMRVLADSFFLPGVLFVGISLLGWVASKGLFDVFSYSVRGLFSMFKTESYYKNNSFYDYRTKKNEKRSKFNFPMLWVGLCCTTLSLIFLVLYYVLL